MVAKNIYEYEDYPPQVPLGWIRESAEKAGFDELAKAAAKAVELQEKESQYQWEQLQSDLPVRKLTDEELEQARKEDEKRLKPLNDAIAELNRLHKELSKQYGVSTKSDKRRNVRYAPQRDFASEYAPRTPEETEAYNKAPRDRVRALAVAAVRLRMGEITVGQYADAVDALDPFVAKGPDPIPTRAQLLKYMDPSRRGKVDAPLEAGGQYEFRIDIPSFTKSVKAGDPVYTITVHAPGTASKVGKPVSYIGIARVLNPKFLTRTGSIEIAMGKAKEPMATVAGQYSAIEAMPADILDLTVWTEVGWNPIRSSDFIDVVTGQSVVGGSEAIMVGSRAFVKNAVLQPRPMDAAYGPRIKTGDIRYALPSGRMEQTTSTRAPGWLGEQFGAVPSEGRTVNALLSDIVENDKSGYAAIAGAMLGTQSDRLEQNFVLNETGRENAPYDIASPIELLNSTPTIYAMHEVAHVMTQDALSGTIKNVPSRMERGEYMNVLNAAVASGDTASKDLVANADTTERAALLREGADQLVRTYIAAWNEYTKEFGQRAVHNNGRVTVDRSRLQGGVLNSDLSLSYSGPFNYEMSNVEEFVAAANTDKKFQEWLNSKQYSSDKGVLTSLWNSFVNAVAKMLGVDVKQGSLLEAVLQATEKVAVAQGKAPITPKEAAGAVEEGKQPQGGVKQRPQAGPRGPAPEAGRGNRAVGGQPQPAGPKPVARDEAGTPPGDPDAPPRDIPPIKPDDISEIANRVLSPADPMDFSPDQVGIKNAKQKADLDAMGIEINQEHDREPVIQSYENAKALFNADFTRGQRLVSELMANPRPTTTAETALLAFEANRRYNVRDQALNNLKIDRSKANEEALKQAEESIKEFGQIVYLVGVEAGRAFNLRKMMIRRDFSLDVMERRAIDALDSAKNDMTEAEYEAEIARIRAEVQKEYEAIRDAELAQKESEVRAEEEHKRKLLEDTIAELRKEVAESKKERKPRKPREPKEPKEPKVQQPRMAEKEKKIAAIKDDLRRLASLNLRLPGMTSPAPSDDAAAFTAKLIELAGERNREGATFEEWADEVSEVIGEQYRPVLADYWNEAASQIRESNIADAREAMGPDGSRRTLYRIASKIAKAVIEQNIDATLEEVVAEVHAFFQEVDPSITPKIANEILSNYGDYTPATKDTIKVKLAQIRGESRETAKLNDVLEGRSPQLTGKGRVDPSVRQRQVTREWHREAALRGINARSEYNAKGALDRAKNSARNEIADLEYAIERKERLNRDRRRVEPDSELLMLREKLKKAREAYNILHAENDQITELERSIAEIRSRMSGPFVPTQAETFVAESEKAAALYAELQSLKDELAALRESDPDRKRFLLKRNLQNRKDALSQRLAEGNFKKRTAEEIEAIRKAKADELQSVAQSDPEVAADIAEIARLEAEVEAMREQQNPKPTQEERRIRLLEARIRDAEKKLSPDYKPKAPEQIGQVSQAEKDLRQKLKSLQQQLADSRAKGLQVKALERRIELVQKELAAPQKPKDAKPFDPKSDEAKQLYAQLQSLQEQLRAAREVDVERRLRRAMLYKMAEAKRLSERVLKRDFKRRTKEEIEASKKSREAEVQEYLDMSPEYRVVYSEVERLRAEAEEIDAELNPKMTPEERASRQNLKRLMKQQEKWAEIALQIETTGIEYTAPVRVERKKTEEELEAKVKADAAKRRAMALNEEIVERNKTALQRFFTYVFNLKNLQVALRTFFDFSAVLTQGAFYTIAYPEKAPGWITEMIRASVGPNAERYFQIRHEELRQIVQSRFPNSGLDLSEIDGDPTQAEELLRSKLAEKIPYIGSLVRGSNRAFTMYLNLQRVNMMDMLIQSMPASPTEQEIRSVAGFVNIATGRGETAGLDAASQRIARSKSKRAFTNFIQSMSHVFWAPKLYLSRMQLILMPLKLAGLNVTADPGNSAIVRKSIAKQYGRFLGGYLGIRAAAMMFALAFDQEDEVEFFDDPRASSFGKIRIGDVEIDYMGGLAQFITFFARSVAGTKVTATGKVVDIRSTDPEFGQATWYQEATNFGRKKLTPTLGMAVDYLSGTNVFGQPREFDPFSWKSMWDLSQYALPISGVEIIESMREDGLAYGLIKAPLTSFGLRVSKEFKRPSPSTGFMY